MVWEQDVRLIVSLTAEVERGQAKCHPYWQSGNYGPLRVSCVSQKCVYINSPDQQAEDLLPKPSSSIDAQNAFMLEPADNPFIIVRHFSLSHAAFPFKPLREVIQLHYPHWPDFGTTSQPSQLLRLLEECNQAKKVTSPTFDDSGPDPESHRPVIVHCSAGCGRTGAFCTVDSVLDMLKRQRAEGAISFVEQPVRKEGHANDSSWVFDQDLDLIAKTVGDFRTQRPSMVQNLSQFVLCYESVLEWIASEGTVGGNNSNKASR